MENPSSKENKAEIQAVNLPMKMQGLFLPRRYKGRYGGRGGAKSHSFAKALVCIAHTKAKRILCTRELQNSITESVHKLVVDQIDDLGLSADFKVTKTSITSRIGSQFIFSGIRSNITKIKSMEAIDIAWVEEAEKVSERSWEVLIPTIRKPGSEIWISWNPDEESDPTHLRFVIHGNQLEDADIMMVNWQDNPWFPEVLRKEKDYLYAVDPEAAAHVWGGACRHNGAAQIFRGKYEVQAFTPDRDTFTKWKGPYFGADWGFANDPTVLIKFWLFDESIYIEYEYFGYGVENDDIAAGFKSIPEASKYVIRADNSRPETISHVSKKGNLRIIAADKWKGSVEDGIQFLRTFRKIVIHPRCTHMLDEARLYSYKVDKLTGDTLPDIVDAHNHGWDSVRYGADPLIKRKRALKEWI